MAANPCEMFAFFALVFFECKGQIGDLQDSDRILCARSIVGEKDFNRTVLSALSYLPQCGVGAA